MIYEEPELVQIYLEIVTPSMVTQLRVLILWQNHIAEEF